MDILWENGFHGIEAGFRDRCVHIKTDAALMDFLAEDGNGALALSDYLHGRYRELYGRELDIGRDSLAVEILIHAYLDAAFRSGDRLGARLPPEAGRALSGFFELLQARTDVIDCGEAAVDSNRFVFDLLAPFHGIIYAVLGDKA